MGQQSPQHPYNKWLFVMDLASHSPYIIYVYVSESVFIYSNSNISYLQFRTPKWFLILSLHSLNKTIGNSMFRRIQFYDVALWISKRKRGKLLMNDDMK